jgi:valyl-tRNA synthetase
MENKYFKKTFEPSDAEKKWYQNWLDHNLFHAMDNSSKKPFSIVIPPPNVTGMLHMGHALNNVLQDIIVRYRRMKGYNTLWMPGTDHAGIATQNVVEQELAKEGSSRHDLGRDKFIERIWEWRAKYGGVIINQLKRLGCSCDWERERFTMDAGLSRAVREVFVKLYNDGLIYQGDYIVNWCPRCHTAISDLEVEYNEQNGHLWNIRYPFADGSGGIIVATTRPETMLGDTAVAVNPDDNRYRSMIGREVILPLMNKKIPIIADEYVSMDFGSGAVKITPACDPNDFVIAERHHLPILKIMDGSATINENGGPYQGQDRYEARANVIRDLKQQGYLFSTEPYKHNIGQCYRCKTDIEPMVSKQWFVRVLPLAKAASAAVVKGQTRIIPSMWEGTYFDWLDNIRDWCISRQIWWGHRIPVWTCDNCKKVTISTDDPKSCPDCGDKRLHQEEDVLDTWFSSALWPFSTLGWPDETPALKTFYPTSLLITGFDILFFWVARMMMMGLYIMGDVPFKDVYLHALVRDESGDKMSKSKGNIIDPLEMVDKYGADAFRFTLAAFTAQGRDIRMSEERIEGYKYFVNKIWNAAKFSVMNLHDFSGSAECREKENESLADRWICSRLNRTVREVIKALDEYRFNEAAAYIYQFIWHEFCDWYLELIKPVLYGKESPGKRFVTQYTLHTVLKTSLQLLHPFMPFVTEEIWRESLAQSDSIMVSAFPESYDVLDDPVADEEMGLIMQIITKVRNIRGEINLPPSKKLAAILFSADDEKRKLLEETRYYIINLANLSDLSIHVQDVEPKHAAVGIVNSIKLYVLLNGIDLSTEVARLEKVLLKVEKEISIVSRKLANRDFLERADKAVIRMEEDKFQDFKEKQTITEQALRKLREIM